MECALRNSLVLSSWPTFSSQSIWRLHRLCNEFVSVIIAAAELLLFLKNYTPPEHSLSTLLGSLYAFNLRFEPWCFVSFSSVLSVRFREESSIFGSQEWRRTLRAYPSLTTRSSSNSLQVHRASLLCVTSSLKGSWPTFDERRTKEEVNPE